MSLKSDLILKLKEIADAPQNEFDKIIAANREYIDLMSEAQLSDIYTLRRKSMHLCAIIPYAREDIGKFVESRLVESGMQVARLEDCFVTAEYIFSKVRGENF